MEIWAIARSRRNRAATDALVCTVFSRGLVEVLTATPQDIRIALRIGELFSDQEFSMVDRTSWVVMELCGITEAVSETPDGWEPATVQGITSERFPLRIFSQGQIAELAGDNQERLIHVIDEAAGTASHKERLRAARTNKKTNQGTQPEIGTSRCSGCSAGGCGTKDT